MTRATSGCSRDVSQRASPSLLRGALVGKPPMTCKTSGRNGSPFGWSYSPRLRTRVSRGFARSRATSVVVRPKAVTSFANAVAVLNVESFANRLFPSASLLRAANGSAGSFAFESCRRATSRACATSSSTRDCRAGKASHFAGSFGSRTIGPYS